MLRTLRLAAGLCAFWLGTSAASAQFFYPYSPVGCYPLPTAPHFFNQPGFYYCNAYGGMNGPAYFVYPPFPVATGIDTAAVAQAMYAKMTMPKMNYAPAPGGGANCAPGAGGQQGICQPSEFPFHPWARSPRDFFMFREVVDDQIQRERRPSLIP